MTLKLHTFTKVFNWCTRNGCPKFTAQHRIEDNLLTVRMQWNEFEVFMFIDIDSQDTLMELFRDTESVEQHTGSVEYCLDILLKKH
jgi:hypothetical protein